ncbi:hypothetical protein QC334_34105 [Streptomyces sp. DH18]|uniref:hypothetical protein n=1 Tax=Streptomyces sp. DH18 TaxID=3040126 RepID=UPI002441CC36|nr:hypothetical protein [Streptomyces sp. DH18]MDG9687705.1 hypothetical protein [Streptomyces sp. DH18]
MPNRLTIERLALFGTLLATFGELHPLCDHWVQGSKTASRKRLYGEDLVHADGTPAAEDSDRPAMTTSTLGRRAVACHVASYSAVQLGATIAITRAFGYRVSRPPCSPERLSTPVRTPRSTAARCCCGWRGRPARPATSSTAVRLADDGTVTREVNGPGSAWMELDAALHRVIGIGAAAVTTWLTTRPGARR